MKYKLSAWLKAFFLWGANHDADTCPVCQSSPLQNLAAGVIVGVTAGAIVFISILIFSLIF